MQERWISEEPRLATVALNVARRGLRRRRWIVGLSLALTALFTAGRAVKAPTHQSSLYFRLSEGDVPVGDIDPSQPRDIREYIVGIALSRKQCEVMMRKHGRAIAWLNRDPTGAIASFREDIAVTVTRNYFLWDRGMDGGTEGRSANVTVTVLGANDAQNRAILTDIRDTILEDQRQRAADLARARDHFRGLLGERRARIRTIEAELTRLTAQAVRMDRMARIPVETGIGALRAEAASAVEQSILLERAAASTDLSSATQGSTAGLELELIDERDLTFAPQLTPRQLVRWAAILLVAMLVLFTLGAGALDDRVYELADVEAHGVPVFGSLPRFPGDDAGSFAVRP
jgi:hypothetical protein